MDGNSNVTYLLVVPPKMEGSRPIVTKTEHKQLNEPEARTGLCQ